MSAYLRALLTPHASRWQPMLLALGCLTAAAGAAVLARELWLVSLLFTALAFAAWAVGACAMVGFVKWLFAASLKDLKRD
ncbi:MAG TPA: hypothetical protein VFC18_01810 [Burkholderiales bacterium]|nr:hypothetical protein [Burkholderiales bacterium]